MRRTALALAVACPGVAVLAGLALLGNLAPSAAILGSVLVIVGTGVVQRQVFAGLESVRLAVDRIAEDAEPAPTVRSANPIVDELWLAIARTARLWRQKLRDSEAALATSRAVFASLPQPLLLLDERGRVVASNPAAQSLFGGDFVDRNLAAAIRNPAVLAAAAAVLAGEGGRAVEFTSAVPQERHLRARIEPLSPRAADGTAAILTINDLTGAKRTEQMRSDFVANASHELRTPLATLLGFIETLRGPARDDPEAQGRFLAIMLDQTTRMTRLVDDLLSLSRIEMNEHQPPTGRVDLALLLGSIADTLALRAKARDMRIVLDFPDELPPVVGDPEELAQLFQNLIDNAVKYGRSGTPITVTAEAVDRSSAGIASAVAVAVKDEGEGIAQEHIPRLTERFYRIDAARSRAVGGTGLGLAIVKHIIGRHRGLLDIESELGRGSCFTVSLPAANIAG
jgi:two-component system, OmpR family, phosphate regulon sensor histidine kinase PhoR